MYNIEYWNSAGERFTYLSHNVTYGEALVLLVKFQQRYLNRDGSPKVYPNGEGSYDIINPRIVRVHGGRYGA